MRLPPRAPPHSILDRTETRSPRTFPRRPCRAAKFLAERVPCGLPIDLLDICHAQASRRDRAVESRVDEERPHAKPERERLARPAKRDTQRRLRSDRRLERRRK